MNTEKQNQIDTLFGGRALTVIHQDGTSESVTARQLPLTHYKAALSFLDDEIALTAFCCERTTEKGLANADTNWALTLRPKSYEALRAAVQEVNSEGFFIYAARQTEKKRRDNEDMIRNLSALDPATLKAITEIGASALQNSSPRPRPISR